MASIPFIVTFFTMSAIPYAFILTSATSRSAEARHLYVGAFIVALAILIFSSWGIDAVKPEGSACMIEPTYDAGVCTVVDVKNTNDVEWMKTCKVFGKRDYAFMYKGIVEKYRLDMAAFHDTYEQLKGLAAQFHGFVKDLVVRPVDEGLPSLVDMAVCYTAFMPCSASCMPIKPCKTLVRDAIMLLIKHRDVQKVVDADCQDAADDNATWQIYCVWPDSTNHLHDF